MARIKIEVEVNTDPVPGWGHDPEDYVKHIQHHLDQTIPHYKPEVRLVEKSGEYMPGPREDWFCSCPERPLRSASQARCPTCHTDAPWAALIGVVAR